MRHRALALLAAAVLAGCGPPSPEQVGAEAARLRGSIEKYRADYLRSVDTGNKLAIETLAWLNGPAITSERSHAASDAQLLMDRWAKVYFAPRYMHGQLRFDKYSAQQVIDVQRRLLEHLKRSYFELHDYQRYAQHAWESAMHGAPPGRLPAQLEEFRVRLLARTPAVDEITPLLRLLPE